MTKFETEIDRPRLFDLFRNMVDIYSPSGKEEEVTEFVEAHLRSHGLPVVRQPVDQNRCNLLVFGGENPDTLLLGHIDTVPAFDYENYGYEEVDGHCHGLGTADMKSGCAAMIEAFIVAQANQFLPSRVLLALVVGEEESGDGTQALLEAHRFTHALVAEPTNLQPCLNHYGYVEMLVRAFGSRRHAAMSGRETNAIRAMLRLLLQLENRVENEEPETVINIRDLHSSESGFAVPDRCAASIDFHLPPEGNSAAYAAEITAFVERELIKNGASRHEIEFPTQTDGYRIAPEEVWPQRVRDVFDSMGLPWNGASFRSHSDANLLYAAGCQPLILGPGLLAKAHTGDESVPAAQVELAAQLYTRLMATHRTLDADLPDEII